MRDRNLARPEAAKLDAVFEVVQTLVDFGLEIACRDDHAIFALKAGGAGFSKFHQHHTLARRLPVSGLRFDNRLLVRAEGLEPPRLSSREPKSRASTNSATPADRGAARRRGL